MGEHQGRGEEEFCNLPQLKITRPRYMAAQRNTNDIRPLQTNFGLTSVHDLVYKTGSRNRKKKRRKNKKKIG